MPEGYSPDHPKQWVRGAYRMMIDALEEYANSGGVGYEAIESIKAANEFADAIFAEAKAYG